ncbi:MAG: DNA mismatch repair endonuclease MutL [Saprospiraceae bacterium]|nr:DNA mismatch repair endonuclease MutL [Saprospiraceae bacterium]
MSGVIKLLPDVVVNQIAAGEVIQRPSSVVKELMDNALDSGATEINVRVVQAGKEMILIQDNGCGMNPVDARMAFERHATSKIKSSEDLFQIQTLGFRGEALASIAAVSRVELKTKQSQDELGTKILIQDSKILKQEVCSCLNGTQIMVSDLFYTVPARKKFLKSDASELRYIQEEFISQALSHPETKMSFTQNDSEIYSCRAEGLKQRIQSIFGKKYPENLIEIDQQTEVVNISGFIGNMDLLRKSRGDQFLYINRRLIKSNYLNHAINSAFEEVLSQQGYPFYVIFLHIDPNNIDINVHPAKHEIKLNDERLIYNFLKATVKQTLGRKVLAPQLDFENAQPGMDRIFGLTGTVPNPRPTGFDSSKNFTSSGSKEHWKNLAFPSSSRDQVNSREENLFTNNENVDPEIKELFHVDSDLQLVQLYSKFILYSSKEGIYIIDQQNAHERILYEFYLNTLNERKTESKNLMFPITIHLNRNEAQILKSIINQLGTMGLVVEEFGNDSFVVQSVPAFLKDGEDINLLIQNTIEQYKLNQELKLGIEENAARALARSSRMKSSVYLNKEEMQLLINRLFKCRYPEVSPVGKRCYKIFSQEELKKFFS